LSELSREQVQKLVSRYSSVYLIDVSWHCYRSFYAFRQFNVDIDGYKRPTGHIYGILNTIKIILKDNPRACIIMCQDGHPIDREKLMEESGSEYKEGRPDLDYDFYSDMDRIKALCCTIPNVYWAYNEDKESDDEMYAIAKQVEDVFDGYIYVYSGDNDLLQAISPKISVIRSREKGQFKVITNYELQNEYQFTKKFHGVDSKHIVNLRSIIGDPSDKIKGVSRFPRNLAVSIAMSTDNIIEGYKYKPEGKTEEKWMSVLEENIELVKRNYKLMKLTDEYNVDISKPKVKITAVIKLLEDLKLNSCKRWFEEERYI